MAAFIATFGNFTSPGTQVSVTLGTVTAGTLLVLHAMQFTGGGTTTATVTDTATNTWTKHWEVRGDSTSTISGWSTVAASTGALTVTFTRGVSELLLVTVDTFSGTFSTTPLDLGKVSTNYSAKPVNTGAITPSQTNAILCSAIGITTGMAAPTVNSGWTQNTRIHSRFASAYQLVTSTAAYAAEYSYSDSISTGAGIAAFIENIAPTASLAGFNTGLLY